MYIFRGVYRWDIIPKASNQIIFTVGQTAQPAEGKILQRGKIIYINEIKSFGKVEDLQYHVMYKDRYYLCHFTEEAKDYYCDEIEVIKEQ